MALYVVNFDNVSIGTAVQDLFAVKAGANVTIILHQIHLDSTNTAAAAMRLRLRRSTATLTLGTGTSYTPNALDERDQACLSTAKTNVTTQSTTSGSFVDVGFFQWDTVLPFDYLPTPEMRPRAKAAGGFVLDLPAVITAATCSGFLVFEEVV